MRFSKMFGLLAVAAAALMVFAGVASATLVTAPSGTTYTGHIEATSENGHVILHASNGVTIECSSFVTGSLTAHGPGVSAGGLITALSFGSCTGGDVVTILENKKGSLEAHAIGSGKATVTWSGATITATDGATGVSCEYTPVNTHMGEITPAPGPFGHATLDINSNKVSRTGDSILCGATATWTGQYIINTPTGLTFD